MTPPKSRVSHLERAPAGVRRSAVAQALDVEGVPAYRRASYRRTLQLADRYAAQAGGDALALDPDDSDAFVRWLTVPAPVGPQLLSTTAKQHGSRLRSLYRLLIARGDLTNQAARRTAGYRRPGKPPAALPTLAELVVQADVLSALEVHVTAQATPGQQGFLEVELRRWMVWLADRSGGRRDFLAAGQADAEAYAGFLLAATTSEAADPFGLIGHPRRGRLPSVRTMATRLTLLRSGYRHLVREGFLARSPFDDVTVASTAPVVQAVLDPNHARALVSSALARDDAGRVVIPLLLLNGLASSEVRALRHEHVSVAMPGSDGSQQVVVQVPGPTGRHVALELEPTAAEALAGRLRNHPATSGPLLRSVTDPTRGVGPSWMNATVTRAARRAGIVGEGDGRLDRLNAKLLRTTFIVGLLEAGHSEAAVRHWARLDPRTDLARYRRLAQVEAYGQVPHPGWWQSRAGC